MKTAVVSLACALAALPALAGSPSYDPGTRRLSLPGMLIGEQPYSQAVLQLGADGRYELLTLTAPVTAGAIDQGRTLALALGQFLVISLDSNPTTGFTWVFNDASTPVVTRQGEPRFVTAASSTEPVTGAGGSQIWTFRGAQAGTGLLRLEYRQPWNTAGAAAQVLELTLNVR
jgi:inhibitor of cysteine peptidase